MDRDKFNQWCETQGITFYRDALYYHILSTLSAEKQDDESAWLKAWLELRKEIIYKKERG